MKITDLKDYHVVATGLPSQEQEQSTFAKPTLKEVGKSGVEVAKGFAKGAGETINTLVEGGRYIQAGLDPTKTLAEYKAQPSAIDKNLLESKNKEQTVGKALEFALEMFYPVQATGVVTKGAEAGGAVLKGVGSKISAIGDDVVEGGVKLKDKLIDLVANIDDKTKTALSRTPKEVLQNYIEIGKKAMQADENITPYEVVGNKIVEGLKQIKSRAGSVGQAKSQIMDTAKVGYQKVGNIAQKTALDIQKSFSGMKLDPADAKIVKSFQDTLMKLGDNPRLKEIDATIDLLQDQLYKAGRSNAVEVTDRITGKLRSALGKLNSQVKEFGGEAYAKANDEYREVASIVRELNARLGKEAGSAGALIKRLFSPSDARTKELFKKLGELTGEDYFRDARLAKFVMEALDDPRAKSLLEELPSATNLVKQAYEYGKNKLEIPFRAAENLIKK